MKFDKYLPDNRLRPYINYFVVSENHFGNVYKVLPSSGLVMGFQYKGKLAAITDTQEINLATAGVSGIADSYKIFKNSPNTGTLLVYFTETGFTHFATTPAHELFNLSISLDNIFDKNRVAEVEEKLGLSSNDHLRVKIVQRFLLSQLKHIETDKLITEAVRLIYQTRGAIRIRELSEKLFISQSPFEKRFRKVVGTSPKKFTTIVRFNTVLENLKESKSLIDICYENNFFDQAHFIKDFKQFTGETPENYKRLL